MLKGTLEAHRSFMSSLFGLHTWRSYADFESL